MSDMPKAQTVDPSTRNVLVVDDEKSTLQIIEIGLREQGYNVYLAKDGKTAMSIAERTEIHFALLDIRLPDTDGIHLSKELKNMYPAVINVLMTGYPGLDSAIEALRNHVYEYLIKPFRVRQVLSVLERAEREFQLLGRHIDNMQLIRRLEDENETLKAKLNKIMPDERQLLSRTGQDVSTTQVQKVYSKQIRPLPFKK